VALAGVGRNTFYEYFDDFEHALDAVRGRAETRLELECRRQLGLTGTPIERLRALGRSWCGALLGFRNDAIVLLGQVRTLDKPLSSAGMILAASYADTGAARSQAAQDLALRLAAAAAAELLVLRALHAREPLDDTAELVAQAAIRLLQ
jgi:AcrR family transcriptional regulator